MKKNVFFLMTLLSVSAMQATMLSDAWYAIQHPQKTWHAYNIRKTLRASIATAKAEVEKMRDARPSELIQHYRNIFDAVKEVSVVVSKYPLSKEDAEFVAQHLAEFTVPLMESIVVMILQHPEILFRPDLQQKIQQITLDAKPFIEKIVTVIDNTLSKKVSA